MKFTSRKRRPVFRPDATRDAKLIVIASEGEITEKIYFNALGNSRIKIMTIPSQGGKSSPEYVCSNLAKFQAEFQLLADDELWMVIDKDRWPLYKLHEIKRICSDAGFKLAVSNPCFELWLAYHLKADLPASLTCRGLARHLRSNGLPFKKREYDPQIILPNADDAVNRAEAEDGDPASPWPNPRGTRIYQIMKVILTFSPEFRTNRSL